MLFGLSSARKRMESVCRKLRESGGPADAWQWDDATGAALATLDADGSGKALAALEEVFPYSWDQVSIGTASDSVRHVTGIWGGLMAGQRLFVHDPEADPMIYALWMPWSDRQTISVRVSCAAFDQAVARKDPRAMLRTCMGVDAAGA